MNARAELARDALEPVCRTGEVGAAQVAGPRRRAWRGVRDADAEAKKLELLGRLEQPRREPAVVEQPPEVVPRVREVGRRRGGEAARVDPAEEDVEPRPEDVWNGARPRLSLGALL